MVHLKFIVLLLGCSVSVIRTGVGRVRANMALNHLWVVPVPGHLGACLAVQELKQLRSLGKRRRVLIPWQCLTSPPSPSSCQPPCSRPESLLWPRRPSAQRGFLRDHFPPPLRLPERHLGTRAYHWAKSSTWSQVELWLNPLTHTMMWQARVPLQPLLAGISVSVPHFSHGKICQGWHL